jgi:hypothetical protein
VVAAVPTGTGSILIDPISLQVWLVDENLVVVRGGSTPDRDGFDNPWPPLDSFQAPYRKENRTAQSFCHALVCTVSNIGYSTIRRESSCYDA